MLLQPGIALLAVCTLPPIDSPPDTKGIDAYFTEVSMPEEEPELGPDGQPVKRLVIPGGDTDSDGDGIPDDAERSGIAGEPLLDFPAYGADPGVQDIFIQADWVSCDPLVEYCGPNNSLDYYQVTSRVAAEWAEFYAPDFAIHVDNGTDPEDPALASVHGAWGGAHRLPTGSQACNADSLGPRYGYFHRSHHIGYGGGGQGRLYGYCFGADSGHGSVGAHELGHNLGLGHGGTTESYAVNCKPHYRSPMNYGYLYDDSVLQFSRGERDLVLNGEFMDEQAGFGPYDEAALASLQSYVWSLSVREDGAIDWNRNGVFEDEPVRASVTWAAASCEQSFSHTDPLPNTQEPTLAWIPGAGAEPARLYALSRDTETGVPIYRHATRFDDCDLQVHSSKCVDWQPVVAEAAVPIPGGLSGPSAIAGMGWVEGDVSYLVIVYGDDQGVLHKQMMHLASDGAEVWSEPVALLGGSAVTDGSPAMIGMPDDDRGALLIAPDGTSLLTYRGALDGSGTTMDFSGPVIQRWDDGTAIAPCYGVGLTEGYQADMAESGVYALIPDGPLCQLSFARLADGEAGVWTRMTDSLWVNGATPPLAAQRPGLAYVPYTSNVGDLDGTLVGDIENGRFYIAYMSFPKSPVRIYMTEGNDPGPEVENHKLAIKSGGYLRHVWAVAEGGVTLSYDHRFDRNLRAIWTREAKETFFNPFADGIFGADMYDVDDYAVMREYIACSLTASCP